MKTFSGGSAINSKGNAQMLVKQVAMRAMPGGTTMTVNIPGIASKATEPRLRLQGINKAFGAVQALRNVDFEVDAGEIVGLVGDNGAGKSTLIKIISGAYTADSGSIAIDGKHVHLMNPFTANSFGIETVYQDLALCDNLDVVDNLFLGREERGSIFGVIDRLTMERRALDVLKQMDIQLPSVRVPVSTLSGGQRQSVAVVRTLLRKARIVLLDEPTAALSVTQTRQVLNLIRHLRDQGIAVVIISHNLVNVFEVVDRLIVLRLGKRVATFDVKFATTATVVATITGADGVGNHIANTSLPANSRPTE
jgi:D-xylose transport system ATP-binding protein